jgi:hypothetical protein
MVLIRSVIQRLQAYQPSFRVLPVDVSPDSGTENPNETQTQSTLTRAQ